MIITTEGDCGDCLYLLSILQALPDGPQTLLIEDKSNYTAQRSREISEQLLALIKSLVVSQPYISECRMIEAGDMPHWRSGGFRKLGHDTTRTLLSNHLRHLNLTTHMALDVDTTKPWITAEPSPETTGMVVINRTSRYQNRFFPWKQIVDFYGSRIIFVGLAHEHKAFCNQFGFVSFRETKTLLDVARLVAGSQLFIGNQSCAYALAEGMKKDTIQETSLEIPDCIFPRQNAQYVSDGACVLPSLTGVGVMAISKDESLQFGAEAVNTAITPKGGWHYAEKSLSMSFKDATKRMVINGHASSREDAEQKLVAYNAKRLPDHFRNRCAESRLAKFLQASKNAGAS